MSFDLNRIKETKNNGKFPNIWTVSSILLNNAWVKKTTKEIRKYFEMNDKTQHIKILWDATKEVFRDNCVTLSAYIGKSESAKLLSHFVRLSAAHRLLCLWNPPGKNTGVGCHLPWRRGSSQPRDQTWVSHIALHAFFTIWATREGPLILGEWFKTSACSHLTL